MADRNTFAGLDGVYTSFINSSGLMNGFSNISATAAASGMRKIKAAQTLPSALPAPNRKYIKGDDRPVDQFLFTADTLPGGNLEFGETDLTLDAAAQNSTNWTLGNWQQAIYGISSPSFANMMLLAHQQSHSQDLANPGQAGFMNLLWPSVQLLPLGEDNPNYQGEGKSIYGATFLPFLVHPTGSVLSTNFGVTDGIRIKWWSKYRTLFYCRIGDGTWTTMTLDNKPVDVASTQVFGTTTGGTLSTKTVSSVVPSTRIVTLSAAPASGEVVVVMYEASQILI